VPKWRKKQRRKKIGQAVQMAERQAFGRFLNFVTVARKSWHTDDELLQLRPVLTVLGKGNVQKGWKIVNQWQKELEAQGSLEKFWTEMIKDYKKAFIATA
jgi:hypothetical protein